ncbi:MAG: hypothetical protein WEA11_06865 [Acidimicrobiales bacterium]
MSSQEDALRAAARELIAAARSLLDAAEAVLDDPKASERVVSVMSIVAQQAQRMVNDSLGDLSWQPKGTNETS